MAGGELVLLHWGVRLVVFTDTERQASPLIFFGVSPPFAAFSAFFRGLVPVTGFFASFASGEGGSGVFTVVVNVRVRLNPCDGVVRSMYRGDPSFLGDGDPDA